jgi:outer membrane protein assembly factor BamB
LIAVDAESGDLLWTAQVGLIAQSPPAVGNGLVYIATAGKNIGGGNDGYLIALDAASGVERWRLQTGGSVGSSPAVDGDSVYVFSSNKVLRALDAQSGQERWAVDVGPDWITPEMLETWYPPTASPAVANGIVYAPDFLGSMIALDAEDGHELWRFKSEGEETHTPAVADGVVFFTATRPSAGWVYAVDATSGEEQWRVEDAHLSSIAVTVAEGLVYYAGGTSSPITYALDAATGVTVWRYQSGGFVADLVYAQGRIYASSSDGKVHVIDAQRGAPLWYADTRNWRILEPIISGELLVIPSQDGTVYTIESGQEDATPAARKVFDVSGLPPCDASRSRAMVRLEGTPAATLLPNAPVIGRWPQIRSDEIPQGISASDEAQAGILATLKDMAACDQATGWMTARSFFTDDYLRRAQAEDLLASFVYDAEGGPAASFDDARELPDGRVGIIIDRGTQPGELVIFAEVDGVWLIDERYEIVPELGGGG